MDVKEAVAKAKTYVAEAFAGESLTNLGLEEVRFDDTADAWSITLGFSRPWDAPKVVTNRLGRDLDLNRIYKTVRIADPDGRLLAVDDRVPLMAEG